MDSRWKKLSKKLIEDEGLEGEGSEIPLREG